ncbi:M2 family metallopeptidase [Shewanella abyssi]|uniref:M3 family metallopeptidase n=1 Tax=Shewanella abyssi TaxID=311789 RepID=UPI00200D0ED4|nr:M3 family metallopeptidase [Shewanella abyssi]MCL1048994.1 M2 family metallopeptidase [Shewanella abyssi]
MPRNTLVLTARLKVNLVGLVILLTSMVHTAASAAVSPIPLLVEQCLRYNFPTDTIDSALDSDTNAITFERQLIGFFNINDRINYYRQYPLSYADRELVLQCQLYLADELALYLDSSQFQSLQFSFANNKSQQITALLKRINQLSKNSQSPTYKAQLHTAQAAFKQKLSSQALNLNISDKTCELSHSTAGEAENSFNGSLASYLIKQPDEQCRKRVWQAYQARASDKNKTALATITALRQQQALQAGFANYSQFKLDEQMLHSSEIVEQFLLSQTHNIEIAPWDLGRALASAPSSHVTAMDSSQWLVLAAKELEALAIGFEWINEKSIRVWHKQRLLGDIYLTENKKIAIKPIRQLVVGQQFGQIELSLPAKLSRYQQQRQAIKAVATAVKKLSKGHQFYLLNTISETADSSNIDALWLEYWLLDKLLKAPQAGSREAILLLYSEQLVVFRSKVAIDLYRAGTRSATFDHHQQFSLGFGKYWDKTADAPFTFSAIVYEGPLYYQKLWQKNVAHYIYQSTKACQDQSAIFDTLVVNEPADSIEVILQTLLGSPITAVPLITRIQHAFDAKNKYPSRCTFLQQ